MYLEKFDKMSDELGLKLYELFSTEKNIEVLNKAQKLQNLLNIADKDMDGLQEEADGYFRIENYENFLKCMVYIATLTEYNSYNYFRMGLSLIKQEKLVEAIMIFSAITAYESESALPYLYIGRCFLALGEKEKAVQAFNSCIEISQKFDLPDNKGVLSLATEALAA
ncbi:MAG: hypothetical protein K0S74_1673 [Chlamydiales bacterium]|jgi:tetratricopeptide (TPR) repeat protein|nr:hypothetical protein [Chlamydiales bacterium]